MSAQHSANGQESLTLDEALENGPPDVAASGSEDILIQTDSDLGGGSDEQPPTHSNTERPSILQPAGRPGLVALACSLVYISPQYVYPWIPNHILPWICNKKLQYLALLSQIVVISMTWKFGSSGGQNVHNNLPNERGTRRSRLQFKGRECCKYLCIILVFVLSVFISVAGIQGCSILNPKILGSDFDSLLDSIGEALKLSAQESAVPMETHTVRDLEA